MVMLRLNIGSGSAHACSALAQDPKPFEARGVPTLALFALGSWANAEHASAEPEPMLSLSMTILAKSSDLGQMIWPRWSFSGSDDGLNSDEII